MNKIIVVIAIVFAFTLGTVFSADIATALKPATEVIVTNTDPIPVTGIVSSDPACPAENVQHWNKIIFQVNLGAADRNVVHPTLPELVANNRIHEIIIQIPTDRASTIHELVADRLNELGYLRETSTHGQLFPIDPNGIKYVDVEYSTICAEN